MCSLSETSPQALHFPAFDRLDPLEPGPVEPLVTSNTDSSTDLASRDELFGRLRCQLERARLHTAPVDILLVLAVDRFMALNGSLGYSAGDRVLADVARRLQRTLPSDALVTRFGGDQFGVLVTDIGGDDDARQLASELQDCLRWPMHFEGRRVSISASIGIVRVGDDYSEPDEVVRDAEIALASAKAGGGARFELFELARHGFRVEQLELETELRGALARGELRLHYQPIISLASGRVRGFEALVRWQHPRQGLLRPKEFLALADELGLLSAISEWTLEHACHQLVQWHERFPEHADWTVSVNIGPDQLMASGFADKIDRVLGSSKLPPSRLILEVTEASRMSSSADSTAMLRRLRDRGVALHIDDFGTGYATLSYLHRVPSQALKIDASFIIGITADERRREIVHSIIDLAHSLGLKVVAEGVETPLQLRLLEDLGCDDAQGFYFSRPLAPASLEEMLAIATPWIEDRLEVSVPR